MIEKTDKYVSSQDSEADIRKNIVERASQIKDLLYQALSATGELSEEFERKALLSSIRNSVNNLIEQLKNAAKLKDGEVI